MTDQGPDGYGTVQWLNEYLPASFPRVSRVRCEPLGETRDRPATARRLYLTYRAPTTDAPRSLVLKPPAADPGVRRFKESLGLPGVEVGIHRRLAGTTPVRIPRLHVDVPCPPAGASRVLVLEDIGSAGQYPTGSPEWLRPVVRALAAMHARWWGRVPPEWTWLPPENADRRAEYLITTFRTSGVAAIERAEWLPESVRRSVPLLVDRLPAILHHLAGGPSTVVHGDLHRGNVIVASDAAVGVVDWEAAARARGPMDLAFLLCSALPEGLRPRLEPALLAEYHRGLHAAGIPYPAGDLRADFDVALLYHFVRRVAMRSVFAEVPRDRSMANAVASIVDNEALGRLSRLG